MKLALHGDGERRIRRDYLFGGRMRTSTFVLIVAFVATWWLFEAYKPPPPAPAAPETAVVPPGFVPDPQYTWVPRTNVQEQPRTTTRTTTTTVTTTPTETSPTETSPTSPTNPTSPTEPPTTTVVDPDGIGPLPPQTLTLTPVPSAPTTIPTTAGPGPGPVPTTPAPAR
jgi:cytoskeletal protein RodZ